VLCRPLPDTPCYRDLYLYTIAFVGAMLLAKAVEQTTPLGCIATEGVPADAVPVTVTWPATDLERATACGVSPTWCTDRAVSRDHLKPVPTLTVRQTACGVAGWLYSYFTNTDSDLTCTCSFTSAFATSFVSAQSLDGSCSTMTTWVREQRNTFCVQ
jgi:hypothetical protein